jgi:hypothetical protein
MLTGYPGWKAILSKQIGLMLDGFYGGYAGCLCHLDILAMLADYSSHVG